MPPPSPLRRTLTHLVDLVLVPLIVLSFGTGVVMWFLDLGGTEIHKWSSVGFMIAAIWHLELHWRMFSVHFRGLLRRLVPRRKPKVVVAPPESGWVIEVAPGWTQGELDQFVRLRSFFEDNGGQLDSLSLEHVRGTRHS